MIKNQFFDMNNMIEHRMIVLQIAPADLEDVLASHPAILDAAVTG